MVKTLCLHDGVTDLIPGQETEIPHATVRKKKKKARNRVCNNKSLGEKVLIRSQEETGNRTVMPDPSNPQAGREKASKTMQLEKREVYC